MKSDQRIFKRAARAGVAAIALALLAACAAGPGASSPVPADARLANARVAGKQYLTTVATGAASSSGPGVGVGVGGGGVGGSGWSGVGVGGGLSFDLTSLFERSPEQTAKVYRYSVQMPDGAKRDIDSTLDVEPGACVTTIDSAQPGYPRLAPSNEC